MSHSQDENSHDENIEGSENDDITEDVMFNSDESLDVNEEADDTIQEIDLSYILEMLQGHDNDEKKRELKQLSQEIAKELPGPDEDPFKKEIGDYQSAIVEQEIVEALLSYMDDDGYEEELYECLGYASSCVPHYDSDSPFTTHVLDELWKKMRKKHLKKYLYHIFSNVLLDERQFSWFGVQFYKSCFADLFEYPLEILRCIYMGDLNITYELFHEKGHSLLLKLLGKKDVNIYIETLKWIQVMMKNFKFYEEFSTQEFSLILKNEIGVDNKWIAEIILSMFEHEEFLMKCRENFKDKIFLLTIDLMNRDELVGFKLFNEIIKDLYFYRKMQLYGHTIFYNNSHQFLISFKNYIRAHYCHILKIKDEEIASGNDKIKNLNYFQIKDLEYMKDDEEDWTLAHLEVIWAVALNLEFHDDYILTRILRMLQDDEPDAKTTVFCIQILMQEKDLNEIRNKDGLRILMDTLSRGEDEITIWTLKCLYQLSKNENIKQILLKIDDSFFETLLDTNVTEIREIVFKFLEMRKNLSEIKEQVPMFEKLEKSKIVENTKIEYDSNQLNLLILNYLKENQYFDTLKTFEKESKKKAPVNENHSLNPYIVNYLKDQHANCEHPIECLPKFDLMKPHSCPKPVKNQSNLFLDVMNRKSRYHFKEYVYSNLAPSFDIYNDDDPIICCDFHQDSQTLLCGSAGGNVYFYDKNGKQLSKQSPSVEEEISNLTVTSKFATLSLSNEMHMYKWTDFSKSLFHQEACSTMKLNHAESQVVCGKSDVVEIYDVNTFKKIKTFQHTINEDADVEPEFHPNDQLLIIEHELYDIRMKPVKIHRFDSISNRGYSIFHPNGYQVVIDEGIWDLRTFQLSNSCQELNDVTKIKFSPNGSVLYACQNGGSIKLIDSSTYQVYHKVSMEGDAPIASFSLLRDEKLSVVSDQVEFQLRVFDIGVKHDVKKDAEEEDAEDDEDIGGGNELDDLIHELGEMEQADDDDDDMDEEDENDENDDENDEEEEE